MEPGGSHRMAMDPQSEGRNTLLVLAQFCPKCSVDIQLATQVVQLVHETISHRPPLT